jgi:hypothetical protein
MEWKCSHTVMTGFVSSVSCFHGKECFLLKVQNTENKFHMNVSNTSLDVMFIKPWLLMRYLRFLQRWRFWVVTSCSDLVGYQCGKVYMNNAGIPLRLGLNSTIGASALMIQMNQQWPSTASSFMTTVSWPRNSDVWALITKGQRLNSNLTTWTGNEQVMEASHSNPAGTKEVSIQGPISYTLLIQPFSTLALLRVPSTLTLLPLIPSKGPYKGTFLPRFLWTGLCSR